jgi:hypothetical protein
MCDRCSAKSLVTVNRPDGLELAFCGHHYDQHALQLFIDGFRIIADARAVAASQ